MGHIYTIEGKAWQALLRLVTFITLFGGTYTLVQAVLLFVRDIGIPNLSLLVIVVYLMQAPFFFLTAVFWAYGIHRMSRTENGDRTLILGYAMLVMADVDNLVYTSIHQEGNLPDYIILCAIKLVCSSICFLYYQGIGNRGITCFAAILLAASVVLEMSGEVRYLAESASHAIESYSFIQTFLEALLAVEGLLLVLSVKKGYIQKR